MKKKYKYKTLLKVLDLLWLSVGRGYKNELQVTECTKVYGKMPNVYYLKICRTLLTP